MSSDSTGRRNSTSGSDPPFHSLQLDRLGPTLVGQTVYYLRVHIKRLFADADLDDELPAWAEAARAAGQQLRTGFDLEFAFVAAHSKAFFKYGDFSAAFDSANVRKNRYIDVMPPNATRVVLTLDSSKP